jgi:hypothetical protein
MFLRKIIDVKIKNNQISVTRDASITVDSIENQIKELTYSGQNKAKDPDIENSQFPPFIQSFYFLFFKSLRIPTEKEYCDTYVEWMGGSDAGYLTIQNTKINAEMLINRMKRTYPSLIRDLHFLYLLEDSKVFEEVEYSMQMDYFNGLDLKVVYMGVENYVSIFIDTTRGKFFKQRKKMRHDYTSIKEIEFSVAFSNLKKIGNINLLTKDHVFELEEKLKQSNNA